MTTFVTYIHCSKWKFRSAGIPHSLKAKQGYTIRKIEKDKWI
jgi:hypothetical protein